jgi:hypothetical protein
VEGGTCAVDEPAVGMDGGCGGFGSSGPGCGCGCGIVSLGSKSAAQLPS